MSGRHHTSGPPPRRAARFDPLDRHTALRRLRSAARLAALTAFAVIAGSPPTPAAEPARDDATTPAPAITLERIMAHPDWLGRAPERPYWADDGRSVYYFRSEPAVDGFDPRDFELYQADLDGAVLRRVEPEHYPDVDVPGGVFDRERRRKTFAREGDVYVKDLASGSVRQLTRTGAVERAPFFLADGRIGWIRDNQVFARDLASGLEEQLFDLRAEQNPLAKRSEERIEADYLRRQQERLFDWIRDEDQRATGGLLRTRDRQLRDPARPDPPIYFGDEVDIEAVYPSPDGERAIVATAPREKKPPGGAKMPQYVSASGAVDVRNVRPKVGAPQEPHTLWLLARGGAAPVRLDVAALPEIATDPLADLRAAAEERARERREALEAEARAKGLLAGTADEPSTESKSEAGANDDAQPDQGKDQEKAKEKGKAEPRPLQAGNVVWSPDGEHVVLDLYSNDNKDRWLATLDDDRRALVALHHEHDPAWINWDFREIGFIPRSDRVFFLSEESGWSQLYVLDFGTGGAARARRLTDGDYVVRDPVASPDGRHLYYAANESHPGNYEIFRVAVGGGRPERLTSLGGLNEYVLAPQGDRLLLLHSSSTRPPELWLQAARSGVEAKQITHTVSDEFAALPWVEPEVIEVPSSHAGRPIYARLYRPTSERGIDASGKRPAVVFIHGAGYLQNAHFGWSSYFREFMFHTLLAQHGYLVLDMDYRASAGYGRDWRTAIYRHMGGPELEDLADGVRFLVERHDVDPSRIGAYGGSYGGFLTLMALFTRPELFAAGAALRPVTDWAHYNHPYTSNILNTPELDPEAYERSSPIEFADGLAKPLLLCSGMLDDNVFFQDTVRLAQRLIELEKTDWELAPYPVEPHGFREPSSWLDEYRRILQLFERHLQP